MLFRSIKIKDFNALATSLKINEKSRHVIYARLINVLPQWITRIHNSFLSEKFQKAYIDVLNEKYDKLFSEWFFDV